MLLSVNTNSHYAEKKPTKRLHEFGYDERGFQDILFKSLDRLLADDEIILIKQSKPWQEEPDLMAVDKDGSLYIFELKAGESQSSNLLQVLRYGQLFGSSKYADLNTWYQQATDDSHSLSVAHQNKFGVTLTEEQFNRKQVFIVMTNGLEYKTREAIQYWRSCGLDIRPWVYRVYDGVQGEMLIEIAPFRVKDNPYEDISGGYYILNTNSSNDEETHKDMLAVGKAAAYYTPWKYNIERLARGNTVFLYQTGVGIVAFGEADERLVKTTYEGNPEEEYFRKLHKFKRLAKPVTAREIKQITGVNYVFMKTMFGLDEDSGKAIHKFIHESKRA